MGQKENRVLLKDDVRSLDGYLALGGFQGLGKALSLSRKQVIEEVKQSGLRGRGGAGFPTGAKWEAVASDPSPKKYLVCNFAEGEPGTFKDRHIVRRNPYQAIEGVAIAAYAVGAARSFIGVKNIFRTEIARLAIGLKEAEGRGLIGKKAMGSPWNLSIEIREGPNDYLFGEETALMRVIEEGPCQPRMKPAFIVGLGNGMKIDPEDDLEVNGIPTLVNNLETLAHVSHVLRNGPDWFRLNGTGKSPGTMVFTLSGDVKRPGVYELSLGTPLSGLIYDLGEGPVRGGVKAVLPGGPSNRILSGSELEVSLDYDSLRDAGSGLGSGCVIVFDETACMVRVARRFASFFSESSCGQCFMCNAGTDRMTALLTALERGEGNGETVSEIWSWIPHMVHPLSGRCYLVIAQPTVVSSILRKFPGEFVDHIEHGPCRLTRRIPSFKLLDFDEEKRVFVMADFDKEEPIFTLAA